MRVIILLKQRKVIRMQTPSMTGDVLPKGDHGGQSLRISIATGRAISDALKNSPAKTAELGTSGVTPERFKSDVIGLLPQLRRFAMSLTRSMPDADDLVQEACATAFQKWRQYDPSQPLDRWMMRVLRNLWVSEVRKRKVRFGRGHIPAEDATELRSEDAQEDRLLAQQVQGEVRNLPAELSEPLMLVCAEGYSYREAADLLGVPIGTIMSRIHRARKILAATLVVEERA